MFIKRSLLLLVVFILTKTSTAQTFCSALGQNPGSSFPVCGTLGQTTVPVCGGRQVPNPCNDPNLTDKNPYWYKFTCFKSGTFAFVITPNNAQEDYDWQIFDITNHAPTDVYTTASLAVACDWSGEKGPTGASSSGTSLVECEGLGVPLFTSMPTLIEGHNYLLLVSHYSDSQSGYALSFGGGGSTAVITDTTQPHLQNASISCDNLRITVTLNKKMKCSSLSSGASSFSIAPSLAAIISATSPQCHTGFDMDSIILTLNTPLPQGNYTVTNNTNNLVDNCGTAIPSGENIPLAVSSLQPTLMDSLTQVGCAPDVLQLVFKNAIACSSIAADGSDFIVTGTSSVSVISAKGNCPNNLTNVINVQLSKPIQQQGSYQIKLVTNTLLNDCGVATPAASLNFSTKDTVSALFSYQTRLGCKVDTIDFLHDGRNGVNEWQWSFDNNIKSTLQNPTLQYTSFGQKQVSLIVSNGVCSDTVAGKTILLDNELKAAFEQTGIVCPGTPAVFKNNSTGNIISWNWNFNNGNVSTQQSPPPQTYFVTSKQSEIPVELTVKNNIGCTDSITQFIEVVDNCYIAVPSAFTPNNDGLNDYLYPLNAYKATNLTFKVFNRLGQLVFETEDWTKKWDGSFKGQPADAGAYIWLLQYTDKETGKKYFTKGTSLLIR